MKCIMVLFIGAFVVISCRLRPAVDNFPDTKCRKWCATQKSADYKRDDYFTVECFGLSPAHASVCKGQCMVKRSESLPYDDDLPFASMIMEGDIRCHNKVLEAIGEGIKTGVCYGGNLTEEEGGRHPDPEKCQALQDEAEEECKKLPPDPASMDQMISNSYFVGGDNSPASGDNHFVLQCSGFAHAMECERRCEVKKLTGPLFRLSECPLHKKRM